MIVSGGGVGAARHVGGGTGGETATAERQGVVKGPERWAWELTPLEGVGPLRFGLRVTEVAAVLPDMSELRRFQADPWFPKTLGMEFGAGRGEPAVSCYFIDGRLFCVAVDGVHGPQVTLWGGGS
ncbi:hypothetical protein GCM10020256_00060 [Streptomyces thermocoprophilus]